MRADYINPRAYSQARAQKLPKTINQIVYMYAHSIFVLFIKHSCYKNRINIDELLNDTLGVGSNNHRYY